VIRVLLADDHAVVREGLEQVLATADDIEHAGSASDGEEAVRLSAETEPDVVLMDLSMPRVDGIEATERIVRARPEAQVVVLTTFSDRERILRALDAGAIGYLLKDAAPEEVLEGIRTAARGESPLSPRAARTLIAERTGDPAAPKLSERERDVLVLVADGLPNKQIARKLAISEKTVKAHLTSVFKQIGVFDRTQAAIWAREHGLHRS
jgi:DNA-binding NarL/FixJ family response regulator